MYLPVVGITIWHQTTGNSESLIRRIVYENPVEFFSQSRNFNFTPPDAVPAVQE